MGKLFYKCEGVALSDLESRGTKKNYIRLFKKLMNSYQSFAQTEYNLATYEL
jgi:hypothetical protein